MVLPLAVAAIQTRPTRLHRIARHGCVRRASVDRAGVPDLTRAGRSRVRVDRGAGGSGGGRRPPRGGERAQRAMPSVGAEGGCAQPNGRATNPDATTPSARRERAEHAQPARARRRRHVARRATRDAAARAARTRRLPSPRRRSTARRTCAPPAARSCSAIIARSVAFFAPPPLRAAPPSIGSGMNRRYASAMLRAVSAVAVAITSASDAPRASRDSAR